VPCISCATSPVPLRCACPLLRHQSVAAPYISCAAAGPCCARAESPPSPQTLASRHPAAVLPLPRAPPPEHLHPLCSNAQAPEPFLRTNSVAAGHQDAVLLHPVRPDLPSAALDQRRQCRSATTTKRTAAHERSRQRLFSREIRPPRCIPAVSKVWNRIPSSSSFICPAPCDLSCPRTTGI
jgi:hypothetical protein